MQLPDKVQTAIKVLGTFDMAPNSIAPWGYRQFLRLRPDTPPPLWGASTGYWTFHAALTAVVWSSVVMLLIGYLTRIVGYLKWHGSAIDGSGPWGLSVLGWLGLVCSIAGIFGWADTCEKRRNAAREAAVLGLPRWEHFHAAWRPSLDDLSRRTAPVHYWLRSLWGDSLVMRAGAIGMVSFVALAFVIPEKAGSYGYGVAVAYMTLTVVGFSRTHKRKPLPQSTICGERAAGWRCANGFWIGTVLAAVVWELGAGELAGYPTEFDAIWNALAALILHISEWFSFAQQKGLALRAERAEQSRQLAEVRLQMLKNQIEPHFIFNSLAHLKALIKSDPDVAERMADELSDFLRASLASLRLDRVTVAQDFELVRAYLALASLRMGDRLQVDLHVDPDTSALPIPPLLLQTLVENAIQHGIEPKPGPGHITVSASTNLDTPTPQLVLSVSDDGLGFGANTSSGSGLGLANIRERLASTFGAEAKLTLTANTPQGVVATLLLPMQPQP